MANHPNRGEITAASNPSPAAIQAARLAAKLSRSEAAGLVVSSVRSWEKWESGERRMHPAIWELFQIKVAMFGKIMDVLKPFVNRRCDDRTIEEMKAALSEAIQP